MICSAFLHISYYQLYIYIHKYTYYPPPSPAIPKHTRHTNLDLLWGTWDTGLHLIGQLRQGVLGLHLFTEAQGGVHQDHGQDHEEVGPVPSGCWDDTAHLQHHRHGPNELRPCQKDKKDLAGSLEAMKIIKCHPIWASFLTLPMKIMKTNSGMTSETMWDWSCWLSAENVQECHGFSTQKSGVPPKFTWNNWETWSFLLERMKVKHNGCPNNDWALLWTHHLLRSPALHSDSNPMVLKHLKIKSEVNTHRGRWKTTVLSKSGLCLTYSLLANLMWQGAGSSSKSVSLSPWLEKCHWKRCRFPYFPWSFCGPQWFYVRSPESHWGHIPPCVSWLPPRWDHHAHLRADEIGRLRQIETHNYSTYQTYHIGNPFLCVQNISEYPIPQCSSCPTLWDRPNGPTHRLPLFPRHRSAQA